MDITLFELHLPGAEFNAPFAGRTGGNRGSTGTDEATDRGSGRGSSGAGAVFALASLAGLAVLAWYLRREPAPDAGVDE